MSAILQQAFRNSNFEEVKNILSSNPSEFESINQYSRAPIYSSLLKNGQFTILDILIDKQLIPTDLYEYDTYSNSLFSVLFKDLKEDPEGLLFLENLLSKIENIDEVVKNETLIQLAVGQNAKPLFIQKLISAGCNPNYKDNSENSYLHLFLAKHGLDTTLLNEYISLFIDEGVDVNAENILKKTPLFIAVSNNKVNCLTTLLDNGAQINHQDKDGQSIYYECIVNKRSYDIAKKLTEYESIDFEKTTNSNETILFNFLKNCTENETNLFDLLLEQSADFYQASFYYEMRTPISLLPQIPFSFFEKAIQTDKIDLHKTDNEGNTLLHTVCNYNLNHDQNKAKELYKKVKFLLTTSLDSDATNNDDKTALQLALTDNLKDKIVTLLLNSKPA